MVGKHYRPSTWLSVFFPVSLNETSEVRALCKAAGKYHELQKSNRKVGARNHWGTRRVAYIDLVFSNDLLYG